MMALSHSSGRAIQPPSLREPKSEAVLLSVFGDESADEKEERVFAIAGVVGWESDWQKTEIKWIERTGGKIFSAAKCEYQKEFDLYKDLTQILAESRLGAYGAALDLAVYRKYFSELPNMDQSFYACFMRVVQWLTENAVKRHNESIKFTFHHRQKSEYNTAKLYDSIVNMPEWEENVFMDHEISFTSDKTPRIQMADLVVRETMKALDNQLLGLPERDSMKVLCAGRVRIDILGEDYCSGWRSAIDDDPSIAARYGNFLDKFRLTDNMSNRIRFMQWLNSKSLRKEP